MTTEEILKARQEEFNLSEEDINNLRTKYIQNLQTLADGFLKIKGIIESGNFTSESDWVPLFTTLTEEFHYVDNDGTEGDIDISQFFSEPIPMEAV